ncbi:MAG: prolyl oligopeptidase family serine peptidase [Planctomycetota bacterium]
MRLLLSLCLAFTSLASQGHAQHSIPPDIVQQKHVVPETGNEVWVYHPRELPSKKLPCILIAPAGSRIFHGMPLADGDVPEHLPYVRAGFVVIAYAVDGEFDGDYLNRQAYAAAKAYASADGGLKDAFNALKFTLVNYDFVDPSRIYVAGHSSAATIALALAHRSKSIRGCVACSPCCDVTDRLGNDIVQDINLRVSGFAKFVREHCPTLNVANFECPVFVFNALDDLNTTPDKIRRFVTKLEGNGVDVTQKTTASGGHYGSMIEEGVPAGIEWLLELDAAVQEK